MKKLISLSITFISFFFARTQNFQEGFQIVEGSEIIESVTCFDFLSPDSILLARQNGEIYLSVRGTMSSKPLSVIPTISSTVGGDRGLIGMRLDPNYPESNWLYVTYTVPEATHNRVSRFRLYKGAILPETEELLVSLSEISSKWHVGGAIVIDDEGYLFTTAGDNSTPENSQDFSTTHGKMLRIHKDGRIPSDNPFYGEGEVEQLIWTVGLRNPYTMDIHRPSGTIFINDVGKVSWEEINRVDSPGMNFGWPLYEGFKSSPNDNFSDPYYAYPHTAYLSDSTGNAVTGGAFYPKDLEVYPPEFRGKYYFLEFSKEWINSIGIDISEAGAVQKSRETFAYGIPKAAIYLTVGPDGYLYFFSRFENRLFKIIYYGGDVPKIFQEPKSSIVMEGDRTSFEVRAAGGGELEYEWFKDEIKIPNAVNQSYGFGNTQKGREGEYFVRISNSFGSVDSEIVNLKVIPKRNPPHVEITFPVENQRYRAGQTISFKGTAVDEIDGTIGEENFEWFVDFHHDDHVHDSPPVAIGVNKGDFLVPNEGETALNVWFEFTLRVKNEAGLIGEKSVNIFPRKSKILFQTDPPGLKINIDGPSFKAPYSNSFVEGMRIPISVTSQKTDDEAKKYYLSHWSDDISKGYYTVPIKDDTVIAYFSECTVPKSIQRASYRHHPKGTTLYWQVDDRGCAETFFVRNTNTKEEFHLEAKGTEQFYELTLSPEDVPYGSQNFKIFAKNEFGISEPILLTIKKGELGDFKDFFIFMGDLRELGNPHRLPDVWESGWEFKANQEDFTQMTNSFGDDYHRFKLSDSASYVPSFIDTYFNLTSRKVEFVHLMSPGSALTKENRLVGKKGNDWSEDGKLRVTSIKFIKRAMEKSGTSPSGIIWRQGEADALALKNGEMTLVQYKEALKNLFQAFRNRIDSNIPIYIIELGVHLGDEGINMAYEDIRRAQSDLCKELSEVYIVYDRTKNFEELGWMRNNVHYNQGGLNDIGAVTAKNIVELKGLRSTMGRVPEVINEEKFFSLYPNPAKEKVTITSTESLSNHVISLYNMSGQIVKVLRLVSTEELNSVEVDLTDLLAGIYIVKSSFSQTGVTLKVE